MAKIQDIPFELLDLIFQMIYLMSRPRRRSRWSESDLESDEDEDQFIPWESSSHPECPMRPEERHALGTWADKHTCSPAKFPFNVANTCKLWRDAVFKSPENWIELQFDLASDPHHLLGSIAASKTLLFNVHIFTTANDTSEARKLLENKRAQAIVKALLLHAERCTSIVFDLTYASSLPSPAPFLARIHPDLTDLILDYKIYDLPMCYAGTQIESKPVPSPLKKLSEMSMCGSAFMDIIHLGTEWLQAQPGPVGYSQDEPQAQSGLDHAHSQTTLTLHLRDFEFPACNDEMTNREYTLVRFINLLHFINPDGSLHLQNISLAYDPHTSAIGDAGPYDLHKVDWSSSLTFKNVSSDFIAEFLQIGNPLEGSLEFLSFISCSIPPISSSFFCYNLYLSDVPAANTLFPEDDDSLYNIFLSWEGGSLSLTKCSLFNDEFIEWLVDDREDGERIAYFIRSLTLTDCENFTVSAIRRLVTAVNDPLRGESAYQLQNSLHLHGNEMSSLFVHGEGPQLEDGDVSWFEQNKGDTSVCWRVNNGIVYWDGMTISG